MGQPSSRMMRHQNVSSSLVAKNAALAEPRIGQNFSRSKLEKRSLENLSNQASQPSLPARTPSSQNLAQLRQQPKTQIKRISRKQQEASELKDAMNEINQAAKFAFSQAHNIQEQQQQRRRPFDDEAVIMGTEPSPGRQKFGERQNFQYNAVAAMKQSPRNVSPE